MRNHDVADALLERRIDHGKDLVAPEVAGGQDHPVRRDRGEHGARRGKHATTLVDRGNGVAVDAALAQLHLEARPDRQVGIGPLALKVRPLAARVDCGHPHDARALTGCDLDRERVHPADGPVEHDRTERTGAVHHAADNSGALGSGEVVRLQHEAAELEILETARKAHVVDPAPHHIRGDMDVQVETASNQGPRLGRGGRTLLAHPETSVRPDETAARLRPDEPTARLRPDEPTASVRQSERSHSRLAAATRGSTPSSSSIATAASISSLRRAACTRLPSMRRRRTRSSAPAIVASMSAYSHSSHSSRSAAASDSPTAAASPFMKTLRASFRAAAAPGSDPTRVTGMPKDSKTAANSSAPVPETRTGARIPRPGTGAMIATSAKRAPRASTARAIVLFSSGAAVLRSANRWLSPSTGAAVLATSSAAAAELTLKMTSDVRTASVASATASTPAGGAGPAGSKPRTRAPAAARPPASAAPASPRPRTAIAPSPSARAIARFGSSRGAALGLDPHHGQDVLQVEQVVLHGAFGPRGIALLHGRQQGLVLLAHRRVDHGGLQELDQAGLQHVEDPVGEGLDHPVAGGGRQRAVDLEVVRRVRLEVIGRGVLPALDDLAQALDGLLVRLVGGETRERHLEQEPHVEKLVQRDRAGLEHHRDRVAQAAAHPLFGGARYEDASARPL